MREIIQIQVGQCGNQIGTRFWENLCCEHKISPDGEYVGKQPEIDEERNGVYFRKIDNNRYVPRSINVDLEPGTIEALSASKFGKIFNPENNIHGSSGAGNNWAKGNITEGAEICNEIMETLKKEAEVCDCLQSIQFTYSLGGGTGSGLGSLLVQKVKEEFSDRLISTFSILPSAKVSDTIVEPYNAVLSLCNLIKWADMSYVIDNEALYSICQNVLKIENPQYSDLNSLVSKTMCGITTCLRFPGQLNADVRKLATNMIPFPRMHFMISGCSPIGAANDMKYKATSVSELTQQMFDPHNMTVACDPRQGKYITVATIYRGEMSIKEVEDQMLAMQTNSKNAFVDWIPNNIKTAVCNVPLDGLAMSSTFIGNSTSVSSLFSRITDQFDVMLNKKAFFHSYESEGMTIEDFKASAEAVKDISLQYISEDASARSQES